jgi:nucleotide-binding universal stress UspA family protein
MAVDRRSRSSASSAHPDAPSETDSPTPSEPPVGGDPASPPAEPELSGGGIVVAGTALTVESDVVVRTAAAVARAVGARLHVAHFLAEPELPASLREAVPSFAALSGDERRQGAAERLLDQLARCSVGTELLAGTTVADGNPQRRLAELASTLDAALLVVGAREPAEGCATLLGSTASRLARRGVCPLLMVRGRPSLPPRRVLATVDLSPASVAAFAVALDWLRRLQAERVEVFFAVSPFQAAVGEREVDYDSAVSAARRELARLAGELGGSLAPRLTPVARRGFPRQRILEEVEETAADLLVVGSHGRGGYERFLLGSVAEEMLQRAPVSVLVIPAREEAVASESADTDAGGGAAD